MLNSNKRAGLGAGSRGSYDGTLVTQLGLNDELDALRARRKLEEELNKETAVDSDYVDLSTDTYSTDQIVEAAKNSLDFLAALALPDTYKYGFPPVILAIWDLLIRSINDTSNPFPQIALGIPRGHAKTTVMKLFVVWCILYSNKKFILITASTAHNSENFLADIASMLSSPNMVATYRDWRIGAETNTTNLKKINFRGRPIVLAALGAGGSLRGINVNNARPDVMIFEDIQTKEVSESSVQSSALERWFIGTALKAKASSGCVNIFVANMYPGPHSMLKKLKTNPTWVKFISGAILADGTALWEEHRSIKSLIAEFNNDLALGHPEIFFSEVLNDTEATVNNTVDISKLHKWKWGPEEPCQGKFIIIDPAITYSKKGDNTAIGYFEVFDEIPALHTLVLEQLSPSNTIRKALLMAFQTDTRTIVVESVAYQATLLHWFEIVTQQMGISGFNFLPIHSSAVSKNARIATMFTQLTAGEIVVNDDIIPILARQIADWRPMKRDNTDEVLDILTYAPRVVSLYSSEILALHNPDMIDGGLATVEEENWAF